MATQPLLDGPEPGSLQDDTTTTKNGPVEDVHEPTLSDAVKGGLDSIGSNKAGFEHMNPPTTYLVASLSSGTINSTTHDLYPPSNADNPPNHVSSSTDFETLKSKVVSHNHSIADGDVVDSQRTSTHTQSPSALPSHIDGLWHPKPSIPRRGPPALEFYHRSHSSAASSSSHPFPGDTKKVVHNQILPTRHSENSLADPMSAAGESGVFTTKSSPLRPNFASDTPEPFPSHDVTDWYQHPPPKETHSAEVDVDPISGRKVINDYEIIGELGRGVYGKVKLGRNLHTGKLVAIKIIERISKRRRFGKSGSQEAKIKKEIAILKKARHENIVGLLEVIDDPQMKKVYIVLEHVELGEVRWRTYGSSDICLVEYRRYLRDIDGIPEDEATMQEDHHILETARRQIEDREGKKRESLIQNVGPWSLEHGGENEEHVPSFIHTNIAGVNEPSHGTDAPAYQHHSVQFEGETEEDQQTFLKPSDDYHRSKRWSDGFKTDEYHTAIENHPGVDRTTNGFRDTFSDDEADIQKFGSFVSSMNDDMERISEQFRYVPIMTLSEARRAIRDTVLGLEYLHYQGVVHRDIKPANLLETKNHRIKISDFGVSYLGKAVKGQAEDDQSETDAEDYDEAVELAKTVGTPAFYAPELCRTDCDEDNPPPVTNQIDIWALGVTLYCFIYGRVPFHDQNQFVLMRNIAEQEVYIPRRRLKAIREDNEAMNLTADLAAASSDPSLESDRRLPDELEYEEVSDELHDLLQRLLTKDPRERIKLHEVKHHSWLLDDIKNPSRWIDESDPSRITQGKKIEVSKEDVESAVQLNMVDRIHHYAKKIAGVIGLGKSHSRTRAKSTTTVSDTQPSSTASSSTNISKEVKRTEQRRRSLRPDEITISASKAARDIVQSLASESIANLEVNESSQFFTTDSQQVDYSAAWPHRPPHPDRGISTTGSVRTIRPSDLTFGSGALTTSALPSTPQPLDTHTAQLSSIFGGVKNMILKSSSNSDTQIARNRSPSLGRRDPHAEPSLAISNATAAGVVKPPSLLHGVNTASSSAAPSPIVSRTPSASGLVDAARSRGMVEPLSRASSAASIASRGAEAASLNVHAKSTILPLLKEVSNDRPISRSSGKYGSTEDQVARAKEDQFRHLIQEANQQRIMPAAAQQRYKHTPQEACPPSPDDLIFEQKLNEGYEDRAVAQRDLYNEDKFSLPHPLIPSSSEDRFNSGISQSTSNRSLPSEFSAASSLGIDSNHLSGGTEKPIHASNIVVAEHSSSADDFVPHDYNVDGLILQSGHDDGEDSDDSFIEMSRPKRSASTSARSTSVSSKQTREESSTDHAS